MVIKMNAINELNALINQVSCLTETEQKNLKKIEEYIKGNNLISLIDERKLINNELDAINEELDLILFKQEELQKRELQLYERLNIVEAELEKIVQVYDLLNSKSCKIQ